MSVFGTACVVEVYPFEGVSFALKPSHILAVTTTRNLREAYGTFSISIKPGGPNGVDSTPSWSEIITPKSLIVVGMKKGSYAQITMIGTVEAISESQFWQTNRAVGRAVQITGMDFGGYFAMTNYYTLGFLGMTYGAVLGTATVGAPVAVQAALSKGILQGTPDSIGLKFYNDVMVGPQGVLANVFVPYTNNSKLKLQKVMGTFIQPYSNGLFIPSNVTFVTTEGSWISKFFNLFQAPIYEFFVATAPLGAYGIIEGQAAGYPFKLKDMPEALPSCPTVVARVNPTPTFSVTAKGPNVPFTLDGIDVSLWNALRITWPDAGFIQSQVGFSTDEIRNFYMLNPTAVRSLMGDTNTNVSIYAFDSNGLVDPVNLNRYGYRPEITSTDYFYDPRGLLAASALIEGQPQTLAVIMGRIAAHYHPTALMARAAVTISLRPDILPGIRFRYAPFKGEPSWDFYVEGVTHSYDFERTEAVTQLNLSRGLPSSVYADAANDGLLMAVHTGNAQRKNGTFQKGLPDGAGPALQVFAPGSTVKSFLGQISPGFSEPQA